MHLKFIVIIIIVLLIIFGLHYTVFKSIIFFFNISNPVLKSTMNVAMILLTFSFTSAFLILHLWRSEWAIWFYKLSGAWMGFLVNFVMAVTLIWIIIVAVKLAGLSINKQMIAGLLMFSALGASSYGIWNAFSPRVTEVTVPIKHLPRIWENRPVVHLSDIHLGHIHGKTFIKKLVERVNRLNPYIILITGDLFDGVDGRYNEFVEQINRFQTTRGVYFITGNHEHYVGRKKSLNIIKKTQLKVLDNELTDIDGLQILGISYPGIKRKSEIKGLPEKDIADSARILLFHTPTNIQLDGGNRLDHHYNTYWKPDTSFALNKKLNIDLQLSGHTHYGQIFPFNILSRWLFNGFDYGLKQDGDFHIYTSCGAGSWGPPMRTAGKSEIVLIKLKTAL